MRRFFPGEPNVNSSGVGCDLPQGRAVVCQSRPTERKINPLAVSLKPEKWQEGAVRRNGDAGGGRSAAARRQEFWLEATGSRWRAS